MNPSEVEQLPRHNGSLVTYFDIPGAGSDIAFHSRRCELLHCGGCWGSSSFGSCLEGGFWLQELPEEPWSRGSRFGISSEPVNKGWIFPTALREGGAGWLPSIPASRKRVPRVDFMVSFVNNGVSPAAWSLPSHRR